ncbi:membrane hypothetical protein [Agrobacterium deltaense Zutra 3/1]|uniref:Uncharacterized protein n=1 Tax=Agrobacterium deltaense Zutra 3/1 TaxID=1183427 RepID=A0A1S7S1G2_9HYPH|nr:membrane hypothetical protein [Agrobacterium deltaense Zutra 3/1]
MANGQGAAGFIRCVIGISLAFCSTSSARRLAAIVCLATRIAVAATVTVASSVAASPSVSATSATSTAAVPVATAVAAFGLSHLLGKCRRNTVNFYCIRESRVEEGQQQVRENGDQFAAQ